MAGYNFFLFRALIIQLEIFLWHWSIGYLSVPDKEGSQVKNLSRSVTWPDNWMGNFWGVWRGPYLLTCCNSSITPCLQNLSGTLYLQIKVWEQSMSMMSHFQTNLVPCRALAPSCHWLVEVDIGVTCDNLKHTLGLKSYICTVRWSKETISGV